MHSLEEEFKAKGQVRGGILILPLQVAIELVKRSREEGIRVLGLDAFDLSSGHTEPVMEHSPDYTRVEDTDTWIEAILHLEGLAGTEFQFEVVLDV